MACLVNISFAQMELTVDATRSKGVKFMMLVNPEKPLVIYLSGKMSGLPDHNFPAFNAAAKHLREQGFKVINPAENEGEVSLGWTHFMKIDLKNVIDCSMVIVLDGWEDSRGANIEINLARILNIPVYAYSSFNWIQVTTPDTGEIEKCQIK